MQRWSDTPASKRRLLFIHGVWLAAILALSLKLVAVMACLRLGRGMESNLHGERWRIDMEHFRTQVVADGRGVIRFRDGTPWLPANRPVRKRGVALAPELVGRVGKPDVWPNPQLAVPEEGRGGLEQAFDAVLRSRRPAMIGHLDMADGRPNPLSGYAGGYGLLPRRGADVVTTLDAHMQMQAEKILRDRGVRHASIVEIDLHHRDALVVASAAHGVQSDALTAIAPGSVFKLVVAAAALDTHVTRAQEMFSCDGLAHLPHVAMHCWRVHGVVSLVDAIAQSCDVTFAELGVRLGQTAIEKAASRFGLLTTGLAALSGSQGIVPEAAHGIVFRRNGDDPGLLANTAIGQEDVRMTPLAGALLAATVASGGEYRPARLVLGWRAGQHWVSVAAPPAKRACDRYAAGVIGLAMWQAVHDPHGTLYALHTFAIAAKSGTAELGGGRVNAWIVGYRMTGGHPSAAFAITVHDEPSAKAHRDVLAIAKAWLASPASVMMNA
ncbi:stage V sporulation protein D [Alicyclobacillus hesperidum URH17-3-68]|uniref:penicillin-binding transpeptidase domain-containing protein n=1 Tax=Alicyclobacillus hesperidum TaxID=89784 RepID=UPI000281BDEB|nr:penicillin-binding transpeptidase domain-containing protein [Alicyclobacillus hesperidum]EJY57017.1 stage V sporulation protein D [Alicyclobacillus hesperidum URH17-3-68]